MISQKTLYTLLKKTDALSALSIRLVYLTGKSKVPIHPKHLIIESEKFWPKEKLTKQTKVLDVGCGTAQHSLKIAKKVKKIVGVDKDPNNLKISTDGARLMGIKNAEFMQRDVEEGLKIGNQKFDLIIMFALLEHIKNRSKLLKDLHNLLKKDGTMLVSIPNKDTTWKRKQREYDISSFSDPDHKIEYSQSSIKKELEKSGFKIKAIKPTSYDTPFSGFIDLTGGISLTVYSKLLNWKQRMGEKNPHEASGFLIEVGK